MARVIVETEKITTKAISVIGYLKKCKNKEIKIGISTNREVGEWAKDETAGFLKTAICGLHIPSIYLCELESDEDWKQAFVSDGQHRTRILYAFRFENMAIDKRVKGYTIRYYSPVLDENGDVVCNEDDEAVLEIKEFDLAGKTFNDLPEVLKENFDNTELTLVVAENCTMEKMGEYTIRYNNHTPFSKMQLSFAKLTNIAKMMRKVSHHCFFREILTPSKFAKGNADRITMDALFISKFGVDNWIKDIIDQADYLNNNATDEDANELYGAVNRLYDVIGNELDTNKELKKFVLRDASLLISLFSEFENIYADVDEFLPIVLDMINYPTDEMVELSKNRGTRDKSVVKAKYNAYRKFVFDHVGLDCSLTDTVEIDPVVDVVTETEDIAEDIAVVNEELPNMIVKEFSDISIVKEQKINNASNVLKITGELFNETDPISKETLDNVIDYTNMLDDISASTELDCPVYCEENLPSLIYMMNIIYNSELEDIVAEKWFVNYINDFKEYKIGNNYKECLEMMKDSFYRFEKIQGKNA